MTSDIILISTTCAIKSRKEYYILDRKKIAKKLVFLRGDKTREEVAANLKISCSALYMYEQGNRVPRDEIKIKIASYYGESVENIFFN